MSEPSHPPEPRPRERALGFFRALHPFPSLLVAGVALALIPIADSSADVTIYVQLGLGMLCYQFAIGLTNDLVDAENDAVAKPTKPIASGVVSWRWAASAAVVLAVAGVVVSSPLPTSAWLIGVCGLACGIVYDVWLKPTRWSWLPLAIAVPLIPIWVWTANGEWTPFLAWVLPLGVVLGCSLHLANQAPDVPDDRALGVEGIAQRIGQRSGALAVAMFFAVAVTAGLVLLPRSTAAAAVVAVAGLSATAFAPFAPAYLGRDGLFGTLAVGGAAIGIAFLAPA